MLGPVDNVPDLVYSLSSSSTSSHSPGDFPVTPGAPAPRRANKLRKSPRGGHALGFSFVPDDPLAVAHFPYSFSAPSSPTSTVRYAPTITSTTPLLRPENAPKRTVSMPSRKLKKEKPTVVSYAQMPSNSDGLKRRATLSFSFRRRKPDRALPPPPPLEGDLPPLPPPRQTKFTIGPSDSDEEEDDHESTQNDPIHVPDSFSNHEAPTSLSRPSFSFKDVDMSEVALQRRNSDCDDLESKRRRRWTLMTDEDITDQDFAETVFTRTHCTSWDGHEYEEYPYDDLGLLRHSASLDDHDSVKRSTLLALLTTRDLLRTERHYLSQLHNLMQNTHATGQWPAYPSPSIMRDHLFTLAAASQSLLHAMEADPTVTGVARAFIRLENQVVHALSTWCSVVGGWFDEDRRRKLSRARRSQSSKTLSSHSPPLPSVPLRALTEPNTPSQRSKSMWRKSFTSIPSLMSPTRSPPVDYHSIRDLGILPVQRVTRYVLFFRDLLKHTDLGSPSREIVENAASVAMRIAQRCDEAQGHKRFLRV